MKRRSLVVLLALTLVVCGGFIWDARSTLTDDGVDCGDTRMARGATCVETEYQPGGAATKTRNYAEQREHNRSEAETQIFGSVAVGALFVAALGAILVADIVSERRPTTDSRRLMTARRPRSRGHAQKVTEVRRFGVRRRGRS